jgi:hypothetical protein
MRELLILLLVGGRNNNMLIRFSPQRSTDTLLIDKVERGLIINGVLYDFTSVTSDLLPVGPILAGNQNEVTILLPIGVNPSIEAAFPENADIESGPVPVPGQTRSMDEEGNPIPQTVEREPSTFIQTGTVLNEEGEEIPTIQEVQGDEKVVIVQNQPIPEPVIPQVVTMRQARLALLGSGKLPLVEAAIEALPEPPKTAAKIEWEYSQEVHRNKPFVQMLAQGLGLSQAELDQLFVVASTL